MNSIRTMRRYRWLFVALLLTAPWVWSCSSSSSPPPAPDATRVETSSGYVRGILTDDSVIYHGIPFAAPPVGDLRWKAPQDPAPWSGTLAATARKDVCTQGGMTATWHATGEIIGSEDCLYLDVYRPNSDEADLPVYVFLHGGANRFGGAASYDGSILANDQNIIVVIPQYRLGPLGWFTHPALRAEDPDDRQSSSGNFGMLDNLKALEWVQDNIVAFGGDPANVTVGGQSAGGSNVGKLLTTHLAEGLFHKAVIQSFGGAIITQEDGDVKAESVLDGLGYTSGDIAQFLRTASADQLIENHVPPNFAGFADGHVLRNNYFKSIWADGTSGGYFIDVPILIGSTEYEFKNFLPLYAAAFGRSDWAYVYDLFDTGFDSTKDWEFDEIFPDQNDIDYYEALGKYYSLGWKSKWVDELSTLMTQRGSTVYAFLFKWGGPESASEEFAHVFGAAHSMDISFFFGYDRDLFGYALTDDNRPGFEALQAVMMSYLGNFIRGDAPGTVAGEEWLPWTNEDGGPKCMVLDADQTDAVIYMMNDAYLPADVTEMVSIDPLVAGLSPTQQFVVNNALAGYRAEYYLNDEGYDLILTDLVFEAKEGAEAFHGVHEGAGYRIERPDGWQAGDGLVMYAHGFRGHHPRLTVTNPEALRDYLVANGFAWAASSYTANGYDIVSGVESTKALLDYFKSEFGEPGQVFLTGHSMGGHITARTITDPALRGDYVGALPMCGVVGGGSELFSYFLDWGLLVNYYAPGLGFELPFTEAQLLSYQLVAYTLDDPDFKTATMYLSGGNRPLYDRAFATQRAIPISQSVTFLAEDPDYVMSPVVGNADRVYHLDDDYGDQSAAEIALNDGIKRWSLIDTTGGEALMFPVSGDITMPVLTIHTLGDLFVPFLMPQLWAQKIEDEGNSSLFVARAIRATGHCAFTVDEHVQAFADLVTWVDTNTPPGGDDILDTVAVAAETFGCAYTTAGRPADDPDFATVCGP